MTSAPWPPPPSPIIVWRGHAPRAYPPFLAWFGRQVDRAAFGLLLLATGVLLLRPSDLVPALEGAPLYELSMLGCLAASLPRLLSRVAQGRLRPGAAVALVVALVPAVVLSHLSHADTWDARIGGIEAAKTCTLFLLLVMLIDTPGRLRLTLLAAAGSVLGMTALALLSHHGLLNIAALASVAQHGADGEASVMRLVGTGVFNDPNDLALMLVVCLCIAGYATTQRGVWRWAAPMAFLVFAYALVQTHSRGGVLCALAAAGAFALARLGWRTGLPVIALTAAVMLAPLWGRQSRINLQDPEDTFQTRLELWSSALDLFRESPVFGIGQGKLTDAIGQVAHNSFLHAFTEMGALGGAAFLGAFLVIGRGLWSVRPAHAEFARLRPFVLAAVVGYGAGLLALSRCYTAPTQLVLGLGAAFLLMTWKEAGVAPPRLDPRCLGRLGAASVAFLLLTYLFVRVMLQRGGA